MLIILNISIKLTKDKDYNNIKKVGGKIMSTNGIELTKLPLLLAKANKQQKGLAETLKEIFEIVSQTWKNSIDAIEGSTDDYITITTEEGNEIKVSYLELSLIGTIVHDEIFLGMDVHEIITELSNIETIKLFVMGKEVEKTIPLDETARITSVER